MPMIDYDKPEMRYEPKVSTGEHVISNAFYMPKCPEDFLDPYVQYRDYDEEES